MLKIVLVEPKYSGNIGSVCRVMANFGLKDLILINPVEIDDEAYKMAMHASEILENASILENFEELLTVGGDYLIGTTSRRSSDHYYLRDTISVDELSKLEISSSAGILLGREDKGLFNSELERCDLSVSIPTSEEYSSMNISHACAVICYELYRNGQRQKRSLIDAEQKDLLNLRIAELLEKIDFPEHKRENTKMMLKHILTRAGISIYEYQRMMGIISRCMIS